jgi:hypothetical protein
MLAGYNCACSSGSSDSGQAGFIVQSQVAEEGTANTSGVSQHQATRGFLSCMLTSPGSRESRWAQARQCLFLPSALMN